MCLDHDPVQLASWAWDQLGGSAGRSRPAQGRCLPLPCGAALHVQWLERSVAEPVLCLTLLPEPTASDRLLAEEFGLSPRLREVARLLAARCTNAEIARLLGVRPATARHHTEKVLLRLGAASRSEVREILARRLASAAEEGRITGSVDGRPRF